MFKLFNMSSKQGDLYNKFFVAYKQLHHELSAQEAQRQRNEKWKEARAKFSKFEELESHMNELLDQYRTKMTKLKATRTLQFFTKKVVFKLLIILTCDAFWRKLERKPYKKYRVKIETDNQFSNKPLMFMTSLNYQNI